MNRKRTLRTATPTAAIALIFTLGACGAANEEPADTSGGESLSGTLSGGGSSAQEAAVATWQKGFQTANPEVTVNYDPIGSGGGREQFLAGGIAYAGSDAFLDDEELVKAEERCSGPVVEVPVYISPIAVIYNLEGVDALNLTPETLGAIFEGEITQWDDDAIKADNPDAKLPSSKITPVHRSDDSGTTENFTDYLDATSGGSWTGGVVETWPIKGGEAAEGTSGVVSAVTKGQGTIGYADASQAGDLGTAAVKVGEEFVEYSPEAAAAVLDASKPVEGREATDIALEIDRKVDAPGVYPVVLVSYAISCQSYEDAEEGELVKAWMSYIAGQEGQKVAAEGAGSAPLSTAVSEKALAAIETIKAG